MRFISSVVVSAISITSVVAFIPSSLPSIIRSSQLFSTPTATEEIAGTVKWYNVERGFGFIEQDDGPDMYVHATGLSFQGPLVEDERVSYTTEIDPRTNKPKAVNVSRSNTPAAPVAEEEPEVESQVEKVMKVVKNELSEEEKRQKSIKAEQFQRARLAAQFAMPKPAPVSEASVDYDATVRLAFEASGSSGDFDTFREQYLEDTSAMVAKKYQDAIAADNAAAQAVTEAKAAQEKAAAEAKAAEEARIAAQAKAAREAEEKAAREAKAAEEARIAAEEAAKTPEALAAKYGAMDLEERAFTILCDLGMIELHPDPDDPNRDRSKDDEDI